jgi:cytidylate kinase
MSIITLSRELGSRGDDIAVGVAEKLNLRLVGRDLLNQAARQAGVPEVALAEIDELGLLGVKPSREALQRYRLTVEEVMRGLVDAGNVLLVGRGSQIVLAGCAGVLHIRIIAPRAERVRCVQERCHVSAEAAAARIDASDRMRAGYLRRSYGAHWDEPMLYDLLLNTAHWSVESAVDLLCLAAQQAAAPAGKVQP